MAELRPRIVGTGYSAPNTVRKNSDPIFNWLKQNPPPNNPFTGYKERRVLGMNEDLMTVMTAAAKLALKNAGKKASDVDMLLGSASIGRYRNPNEVSLLHQLLKLRPDAWAIPVTNDFSNFNAALLMADALIKAGRAKTILICDGSNWTRNVDYHTSQSVSAGDGAGAAVVSLSEDGSLFFVKDTCTIMATEYFGGMHTSAMPIITSDNAVLADGRQPASATFPPYPKANDYYRPIGYDTLFTHAFFTITQLGMDGFKNFALPIAANSTLTLLKRHKIAAADLTYFPHQSTQTLIDAWTAAIKPGQQIDTITKFGNLGVATEAFNLAYATEKKMIKKNNVILMALGDDIHVNSILLQREGAKK